VTGTTRGLRSSCQVAGPTRPRRKDLVSGRRSRVRPAVVRRSGRAVGACFAGGNTVEPPVADRIASHRFIQWRWVLGCRIPLLRLRRKALGFLADAAETSRVVATPRDARQLLPFLFVRGSVPKDGQGGSLPFPWPFWSLGHS
jgi:hypothetical protein